jgi:hypothetical protein
MVLAYILHLKGRLMPLKLSFEDIMDCNKGVYTVYTDGVYMLL